MRSTSIIPDRVSRHALLIIVVLLCAMFLAPAAYLLHAASTSASGAALAHLAATMLPTYLVNTVILASASAALAVVLGVAAATAVSRFDFRGRAAVEVALALPLLLPPYLVAIVVREGAHRVGLGGLPDNLAGAVLILAVTLYPYPYLLVRGALRTQSARFAEVGATLGLGPREVLSSVVLPLTRPAIGLGALIVMLEAISDFGTVNALGVATMTTAIHRVWFDLFDAALAAQLGLLGLLPPLLLWGGYMWLTVAHGVANPSNRSRPQRARTLTGAGALAISVVCWLPVALGVLLPLTVMLNFAADAFARVDLARLYTDVANTLSLALGVTLASLAVTLALVLPARASRARGTSAAALGLVTLNYAMPAIVLAIALLVLAASLAAGADNWLSETPGVLVLGLILRYTVFAHFCAHTALGILSLRLDEIAPANGRPRWHTTGRVLLPLLRPALMLGGALVFVRTLQDLSLSLVLQPFGFTTLAMRVYYDAGLDLYSTASLYGLGLALLGIYPVSLITRRVGGT